MMLCGCDDNVAESNVNVLPDLSLTRMWFDCIETAIGFVPIIWNAQSACHNVKNLVSSFTVAENSHRKAMTWYRRGVWFFILSMRCRLQLTLTVFDCWTRYSVNIFRIPFIDFGIVQWTVFAVWLTACFICRSFCIFFGHFFRKLT